MVVGRGTFGPKEGAEYLLEQGSTEVVVRKYRIFGDRFKRMLAEFGTSVTRATVLAYFST